MGKITVETCDIEGLKVITPTVFGDERGYFMETYNYNDYKEAGIDMEFVQDNQSSSKKGVLRGLHFQKEFAFLYKLDIRRAFSYVSMYYKLYVQPWTKVFNFGLWWTFLLPILLPKSNFCYQFHTKSI